MSPGAKLRFIKDISRSTVSGLTTVTGTSKIGPFSGDDVQSNAFTLK